MARGITPRRTSKELSFGSKGEGTEYYDATVGVNPFEVTSEHALNILIKPMSIISLVLVPGFLLYGKEVRPFVGNDTRTVEAWVGPVIGIIFLVAVALM